MVYRQRAGYHVTIISTEVHEVSLHDILGQLVLGYTAIIKDKNGHVIQRLPFTRSLEDVKAMSFDDITLLLKEGI